MKTEELNNRDNVRSRYVSPSADVMDVNVQEVLCMSGDIDDFSILDEDSSNW